MKRAHAVLTLVLLGLAACEREAPSRMGALPTQPVLAKGGGTQTTYTFGFQGGLQNSVGHPFVASAKTGDPFYGGVSGDPVYLTFPASSGGDPALCSAVSSSDPPTGTWGAYAGGWKGTFTIGARGQGPGYHLGFTGTREDGTGWVNIAMNADGVKSNNNLTLTFTNALLLVGAGSTPTGIRGVGPYDPQDRCTTFSITAAP